MELEKLKYPIGKSQSRSFTPDNKAKALATIADFPQQMRKATKNLTTAQLDQPYRPGGWTIRQLVHHCADSHMNAFVRFKLALTEDTPKIKPYEEAEWAKHEDYKMDIEVSLLILDSVHARWAVLLQHMSDHDFERKYFHPEAAAESSLSEVTLHYDWHCRHHLAHITNKFAR